MRLTHLLVPVLAAVIVIGAGLALTAGDDKSASGASAPSGSAERTSVIIIEDFEFIPPAAEVKVGTELTFDNVDSAAHTATSGESPSSDGVFDTGGIEVGEKGTITVEEAGEFAYFCQFHPFMQASLTVTE